MRPPSRFPTRVLFIPAVLACLLVTLGWIYPEHRDIMFLGIQKLDPARRAFLEQLWTEARIGHESRMSVMSADSSLGWSPSVIDYAAWPAIAGDHSVSGADLVHNVLETDWILGVADIAARLKTGIATAESRSDRINQLRNSDLQLQRVDPEYATRAGANNVHFLLARRVPGIDEKTYLRESVRDGTALNAIGAYVWYHYSALLKAGRLSREEMNPAERSALARAALADEAFALHFLEDVFAAGHVTGTWGDASLRKGTHDYYNENGFETRSWNGDRMILTGDAWMRPSDANRASDVVMASLAQVIDAASGSGVGAQLSTMAPVPAEPDTFNVALNVFHIARDIDPKAIPLFAATLLDTPIPALGSGIGELPRFRAELGPFIGIAPAAFTGASFGGFGVDQTRVGAIGGLSLAFRVGLGIEGVINESGDGLVFLDVGVREDAASSANIDESQVLDKYGAIGAQVPARSAYVLRLRAPFWLIPGDLLVLAPILGLAAPSTYVQMAVAAGSGGLIPWQAGIATFMGRFQFILGREVGVTFYGYGKEEDKMIIPASGTTPVETPVVSVRTIQVEVPLLEYRPFRSFSVDQSSSLVMQLYGGLDIPTKVSVVAPAGAATPSTRSVWFAGLRVAFDWRHYLGSNEGGKE